MAQSTWADSSIQYAVAVAEEFVEVGGEVGGWLNDLAVLIDATRIARSLTLAAS